MHANTRPLLTSWLSLFGSVMVLASPFERLSVPFIATRRHMKKKENHLRSAAAAVQTYQPDRSRSLGKSYLGGAQSKKLRGECMALAADLGNEFSCFSEPNVVPFE